MAHSTPLTKLEKRTALLLTIIGIMGSLLGIIVFAVPYFFANLIADGMCDDQCTATQASTRLDHAYYITAAIVIFSIIAGFLPRFIYGLRLRRARRDRLTSGQEEV